VSSIHVQNGIEAEIPFFKVETEVLEWIERYLQIELVLELDSAEWQCPIPSPGSFLKLPRVSEFLKRTFQLKQNNYPNHSQKCHGSKLNQPAKGRNDPASGTRLRPHEKRGIFLRTSPIPTSYCGLVWKKNADLRRFWWLGHFDHCWLVCGDR
jgi:hypothetical protein